MQSSANGFMQASIEKIKKEDFHWFPLTGLTDSHIKFVCHGKNFFIVLKDFPFYNLQMCHFQVCEKKEIVLTRRKNIVIKFQSFYQHAIQ